jgi:ABC-type antimicrobial peptide transport system permease subunit
MALGAQRWRVAGELLVEALRLAALGIVPGLIAAFIAARWLTPSQAAGAAGDIWIWLSGPLALLAVVAMASVLPARRALSVDPLAALREQ